MRVKAESTNPNSRPTSIADRLSLLHGSREGWKSKVEEKDATQFTVEGKLSRLGKIICSILSDCINLL